MQGWTCLPDNEDVFDARVGLQVSGEQPFQNLFYMSLLHLHTRLDAIVSCKNHATNYTCILHQQLECKRIQTSLYPPLFTIIVVLIYIYICFPVFPCPCRVVPSGSIWIPTCNPHSICSRTCSHWPSTLLLGPWRIPNSWPRTMKMASRQSAKRWKPCRKTAWSTSFLQVSLASCKYTHLAHVASLYDLTSCSHPFRYVFCIPVSIAVIDSDWRVS